ncbi:hypothetical protein AOQ84DRAFT_414573 [Glonium stellatum]|uniref:Uncharacterized protein n=1 Tax=Glonium stellatum TaxID=574774 RepID=A0A8E2EU98_9PEZI|nr:hypothetical protein AOQ84DRAFT_414573 [Glonium stellatum]
MWQKRFAQRDDPADLLDDGRYKVYGLLGFSALHNALGGWEPNYDKTVEAVYTETAIAVINSTRNLDVLSFAEGPPRTDDTHPSPQNDQLGWPNTPSWVARWDEQTYFPTSAMCGLPTTKSLRGVRLDEAAYVAPYVQWPETPDAEPKPTNPEIFVKIWNAIRGRGIACSEIDMLSMLSMLAQALTGEITASYQPAEAEPQELELESFCELLRKAEEDLEKGDRIKYQMAMCLMLSYRRVFMTAEGHLGPGHSRVLKGDSVVWLYGGKLPFLLRSRGGC